MPVAEQELKAILLEPKGTLDTEYVVNEWTAADRERKQDRIPKACGPWTQNYAPEDADALLGVSTSVLFFICVSAAVNAFPAQSPTSK